MSSKRIFAISVLISLLGHLMVLSAFSLNKVQIYHGQAVRQMKKQISPTQVSFWGELLEEERREVKLEAKRKEPELEPTIKEPEAGPGWLFTKTAGAPPNPMAGVEEMASSLIKEEELSGKEKLFPKKEVPNRRPHLLER